MLKVLLVSGMDIALARAGAGQRMPRPDLGRENYGCAVAVVYVAVDGHRPRNLAFMVHPLDGDCDIVNHTKTLAVVGMGVVKTAADVARHAITQRQVSGQNRSAGRQP